MADVTIYTKVTRNKALNPSNPPDPEETPPVLNPNPNLPPVAFLNLTDVNNSSYLGNNGFVPVVTNESGLTLQPLPQVEQNGLVSGGIVQWTGSGYVFNVSGAYYRIQGTLYSSDPTQKTLSTPDATNNRIDVFAVDNTGAVVVIEGTPSATPVKPQIDPATQLELTSVLVIASSTEPTLTEELIYDENVEWTGTSSGTGTVAFNSTNDPYQGTYSIEATDIENGLTIVLANGSDVDPIDYQTIGMQLKLKESMPSNQNLVLSFLDSSDATISKPIILSFDKQSLDYQFIGLSLASFNFIGQIRKLKLAFVRTSGPQTFDGYFLDVIKLEGGINPPITTGSFLGLQDTPSSYVGFGGYTVAVKSDESGLEFVAGGGGASTFLALTDTPSSYSGQAGLFPRVNVGETALEFDTVSPYDLDQEGAIDGDVLTWVGANSRFEPVTPSGGGSKWTEITEGIYRDGNVLVGGNTFSDAGGGGGTEFVTFEVKSKVSGSAGNNIFATFKSSASTVIEMREGTAPLGLLPNPATNTTVTIGNITGFSGARGLVIRPTSAGQSILTTDLAGTLARFTVADTGTMSLNGLCWIGAAVGTNLNSWGMGVRGFGNNIASRVSFLVQRSTGTVDFQVASNGALSFFDGGTMIFGTTTGMKLGTATTQKIGFWNATPVIQQTTAITAATFTANTSGIADDTATFDGYTIGQVVAALRLYGILA